MTEFEQLWKMDGFQTKSHSVSGDKHTILFVDASGKEFTETSVDRDEAAKKVLDAILARRAKLAELEVHAEHVRTTAATKGWPIAFMVSDQSANETCPMQYSARAKLVLGDKTFEENFSHWDETRMQRALIEQAYVWLVAND